MTTAQPLGCLFTQGATVADFNGDGRPDLAFVDTDGSYVARVFLNTTGVPAPPCVVLDLAEERLSVARHDLDAAGCRLGRVRYRDSRTLGRNRVISQQPRGGSCCRAGRRSTSS